MFLLDVLVACEESQTVCKAFRARGHEAFSCDILPCSGGHPEWHIMQDVIPLLNGNCEFETVDGTKHKIEGKWDMIIAHPPCTYMSKAGARWMYLAAGVLNEERYQKALLARAFFMNFLSADCDKICIENPTPLKVVGLPKETQVIQPYYFGDPFSKRTLLWLIGLPKLIPTDILSEYDPYLPSNTSCFSKGLGGSFGSSHYSQASRSKTFVGIAEAMAEQWSNLY